MSVRAVVLIVSLLDVAALALGTTAVVLVLGPVGMLILVPPIGLFALLIVQYVQRRRAGQPPLPWGTSFGSAQMHRRSAWSLAIGGAVVTAAMALTGDVGAAALFAAGGSGLVLSSMILASHSD